MSASDKLKALRLDPLREGTYEQMLDQVLTQTTPLIDALPQIVAVVEAAETAMERGQQVPMQLSDERGATMGFSTYAVFEMPLAESLAAALTALEEALS